MKPTLHYSQKEIKAFSKCAVCGWCCKVDRYVSIINPKETGWLFESNIYNSWYCSNKCLYLQIKNFTSRKTFDKYPFDLSALTNFQKLKINIIKILYDFIRN